MQSASAVVCLFSQSILLYLNLVVVVSFKTRSVQVFNIIFFFCVNYCYLNESQQDLRMMSVCTILKFCHLHQV